MRFRYVAFSTSGTEYIDWFIMWNYLEVEDMLISSFFIFFNEIYGVVSLSFYEHFYITYLGTNLSTKNV